MHVVPSSRGTGSITSSMVEGYTVLCKHDVVLAHCTYASKHRTMAFGNTLFDVVVAVAMGK